MSDLYVPISCAKLEAGTPSMEVDENETSPDCCYNTFPKDKEEALAWGKKRKMWGIGQICAAVACTGGVIGGVGGGTGNWAAAIGGGSGLFFGLAGSGLGMIYAGNRAIVYAQGMSA